jgi:hypothetical protein
MWKCYSENLSHLPHSVLECYCFAYWRALELVQGGTFTKMTLTREAFLNEVAKFQASYPNSWLQSSVPSILTKQSDSVFLLKRVDFNDALHLDFYIVYSPSYRVPVLFFLPCIAIDNETRFATIDELCDVLLTDDPTSISLAVLLYCFMNFKLYPH